MPYILLDIRDVFRVLRRHPAVLIGRAGLLGLGLAALVAAMSVAYALTGNPVGSPDPAALVSFGRSSVSYANALDLKEALHGFADLTAWANLRVSVRTEAGTRSIRASLIGAGFDAVFEPEMVRGRFLSDRELGPSPSQVAVISERLQGTLGALEAGPGAVIDVNGTMFTVVGVVSRRFIGPTLEYVPDLWLPLTLEATLRPATARFRLLERRQARWLGMTGRLRPGMTIAAGAAEVKSATDRLTSQYPRENLKWKLTISPLTSDALPADVRASVTSVARILLGVGLIALIIGAASNCLLLLMSAETRLPDLTIRTCLGATRARLATILVVENAIVGVLSAGLAVLGASWYMGLLQGLYVSRLIPLDAPVRVDGLTIGLGVVLALLAPILVSLIPLHVVTRTNTAAVLRDSTGSVKPSRSGRVAVRALVAAQVAVALALATTALMLQQTSRGLAATPLNFNPDQLVIVPVQGDPGSRVELGPQVVQRLTEALSHLPGIASVAWATLPPLADVNLLQDVRPSSGGATVAVSGNEVQPEYFETLGFSFVDGGPFRSDSLDGVVLNETAARLLSRDRAVGSTIDLPSPMGDTQLHVVGVVRDSKYFTLDEAPHPFMYFASGFSPISAGVLLIRTQAPPEAVLSTIRTQVSRVAPAVALGQIRTMRDDLDVQLGRGRFLARNTAIFSAVAILAAMAGLFGSLSQFALRRRREIGMRLALGATSAQSTRPLVVDALSVLLAGVSAGVLLAVAFNRLVGNQVYQANPTLLQPLALAVVLCALCGISALAVSVMRARRISPGDLLRSGS